MGKRGPKKTPAETKKRRGTYRADRDAEVEVSAEQAPPLPEGLHSAAAAEWERLTPILVKHKLLTDADWIAYRLGFAMLSSFLTACDGLPENPIVYTEKGFPCQHPMVAIRAKAWADTLKWCREFGLTPSARSGLKLSPEQPAADAFEKYTT